MTMIPRSSPRFLRWKLQHEFGFLKGNAFSSTSQCQIRKRQDSTFLKSALKSKERSFDKIPSNYNMVYYSPNRNLIYSAQFGFLTTGATSIYIFARKFFGDLIVTPQMTAIGVDEAGMIGAGVILVAHVIAFGVLLNRAVLRMYLDDKETEFVLAMPSMLVMNI